LTLLDQIDAVKRFCREAEPVCKAALIAHIKRTGRPVEAGDILWVYSTKRDTKCPDPKAVFEVLLDVTEGDLDAVNGCMSAGAWKHGAVKRLLADVGQPEKFLELFRVVEVEDVKGQPVKELAAINTRFLPSGGGR
jgi:hypothetical protein